MDSICFWLKAEIEKEFEKKNSDFSIIMPTKASSPTKNKGKIFFLVEKSSGPLLGRQPLKV